MSARSRLSTLIKLLSFSYVVGSSLTKIAQEAKGDVTSPRAAATGSTHDPAAPATSDRRERRPGRPETAEQESFASGMGAYVVGLGLATALTVGSFLLSDFGFLWGPSLPVSLTVFAIAQMGVHLVFFLHITTSSDNLNNTMALAFGVLVAFLIVGGSAWIMTHLDERMMPMDVIMKIQR